MFSEQKSKPSNLATAQLILAGVILISLVAALGVVGYLARNKGFVQVTSQNEANDWKTYNYNSSVKNFSFKYPYNWSIQNESKFLVTIGSGSDDTVIIGVQEGSPDTSLEENMTYLKSLLDHNRYSYRELNDIQVDGARVFLNTSTSDSIKQAYLVTGSELISVVYSYYKYPETTEAEKEKFLLEKFLPTFILTNGLFSPSLSPVVRPSRLPVRPANDLNFWKDYKNEEYGFKFQYPDSWDFETIDSPENSEELSVIKIFSDYVGLTLTVKKKPADFSDLKKYLDALAAQKNAEYEDHITRFSVEKKVIPSDEFPLALIYTAAGGNSGASGATTVDVYFETEKDLVTGSYSSDLGTQSLYEEEYRTISLILASFSLIPKPAIFGNLSAYVKEESDYNYMIISEEGIETIVDKGPMTYNGGVDGEWGPVRFGDPSFSPKGNYLLYWAGMHEASSISIYDIKNKKGVISFLAYSGDANIGFTPDEKYFYACSWGGMGSDALGNIYAVPSFKIIYDALSSLNSTGGASCRYDSKTDSIIYYRTINTVDSDTIDMVRYSLKERKEYKLYKEEPIQSE